MNMVFTVHMEMVPCNPHIIYHHYPKSNIAAGKQIELRNMHLGTRQVTVLSRFKRLCVKTYHLQFLLQDAKSAGEFTRVFWVLRINFNDQRKPKKEKSMKQNKARAATHIYIYTYINEKRRKTWPGDIGMGSIR